MVRRNKKSGSTRGRASQDPAPSQDPPLRTPLRTPLRLMLKMWLNPTKKSPLTSLADVEAVEREDGVVDVEEVLLTY